MSNPESEATIRANNPNSLEERLVDKWLSPKAETDKEGSRLLQLRSQILNEILGSLTISSEFVDVVDPANLSTVYEKHRNSITLYKAAAALSNYLNQEGDWRRFDELVYEHQEDAMFDTLRALTARQKEGYIEMATSAGKTYLISKLAEAFQQAGLRVLILGPTKKIADQIGNDEQRGLLRFTSIVDDSGIGLHYRGQKAEETDQVVIATYAGLNKFAATQELGEFDVILADEAHRGLGEKTSASLTDYSPSAVKIGFTATPVYRADKRVDQIFSHPIHKFDIRRAIEEDIVSAFQGLIYSTGEEIPLIDAARQDFSERELAKLIMLKSRNEKALEFASKLVAEGRQGFISCVPGLGAFHAHFMAQELSKRQIVDPKTGNLRNVVAKAITGNHSSEAQNRLFEDYESGKIDVLTFVQLLGEGWDTNRASFGINTCPTTSVVKITQLVGRLLRKKSKEAVFIDFLDETVGKQQVTALHAIGERRVDLGKIISSRQPTTQERQERRTYLRGLFGGELWQTLTTLDAKLVREIGIQPKKSIFQKELQRYNAILAKEGMPEEPIDRLGAPKGVIKAIQKAQKRLGEYALAEEIIEETNRKPNIYGLSFGQIRGLEYYGKGLVVSDPDNLAKPYDTDQLQSMIVEPGIDNTTSIVNHIVKSNTLQKSLDALPVRERRVLELRFGLGGGEPYTLEAIAHELDLTRERVRQMEGQALSRLASLREVVSIIKEPSTPRELAVAPVIETIRNLETKLRDLRDKRYDNLELEPPTEADERAFYLTSIAKIVYERQLSFLMGQKPYQVIKQPAHLSNDSMLFMLGQHGNMLVKGIAVDNIKARNELRLTLLKRVYERVNQSINIPIESQPIFEEWLNNILTEETEELSK